MTAVVATPPRPSVLRRIARLAPYILLAPGLLWLLYFFIWPLAQMALMSVSSGTLDTGFHVTGTLKSFNDALTKFGTQWGNSLLYGGTSTVLDFLIGFPVAYTIAFKGGRYKNLLLFLVIAPFFTSFLIRTISWQILLGDEGPILSFLKHTLGIVPVDFSILYSPVAVVSGLTYNFLPFMILPMYVALEKIDFRLLEAAGDLYGSSWQTFRRVTFPLALPGVFAGSILTFIPAMGDYVNAELLGSPKTRMIGNVIQGRFLQSTDYPSASALSLLLMAGILVAVAIYARALGTEELTG
ncbi:MAG: spermidine/putrescine transport system permease protein [Chloroflexota bacterium]|jgi:spermidine/putrescine transport system permease protein|nr:spermidine/putrescine transport system permease protein [Chloroflexota bacterium]